MIKFSRQRLANLALACVAGLALSLSSAKALATGSTWQAMVNQPSFSPGVSLLLTDGTVMSQDAGSGHWWILTPDSLGNYATGTWKPLPPMPNGYAPLYFASAVLADGKIIVVGGEYQNFQDAWSNDGYIYDPSKKTWTHCPGPWANVGDAQCAVLPNGTFMLANILNGGAATLNEATLTWTQVGTGKLDRNDEEGWTLLPNGNLLTVNAIAAPATQIYNPAAQVWNFAGNTPVWNVNGNIQTLEDPGSQELGPQVLRPDGTVLAIGATGHNAVYDNASGSWFPAADFPGLQYDVADGPAVLLPSGNVFTAGSPGVFGFGAQYFEFSANNAAIPNTPMPVANHPNAVNQSSYFLNMLLLPNGQVMVTEMDGDVEFYTPSGTPNPAWAPTITSCPTVLTGGHTYTLTGTQLNGLSQCNAYGDDSSNASNYPLVRLRNTLTGTVTYCKTSGFSTMAVATGSTPVSTNFTLPVLPPAGPAVLEVVTNGIVSADYPVTVTSPRA